VRAEGELGVPDETDGRKRDSRYIDARPGGCHMSMSMDTYAASDWRLDLDGPYYSIKVILIHGGHLHYIRVSTRPLAPCLCADLMRDRGDGKTSQARLLRSAGRCIFTRPYLGRRSSTLPNLTAYFGLRRGFDHRARSSAQAHTWKERFGVPGERERRRHTCTCTAHVCTRSSVQAQARGKEERP
jgi:hypothetical protein